jgi:hypothetical protein
LVHTGEDAVPELNPLAVGLDAPDTAALDRITSISLIVWYVHQWQQAKGDFDFDVAAKFRAETDLTPAQIRILGFIGKKDDEVTILRYVREALDLPTTPTGDGDGEGS